jgi:GMP synthase (glutamine-hydrolysing)
MFEPSGPQRSVAVLVTGEPIERARLRRGGFAALIRDALGEASVDLVEIDARSGAVPDLREYAAVLITGSPASVTERAPWMLATEARLREAADAGSWLLGICFGHQLLAQALGGRVAKNPNGREIGTVELALHEPHALFAGVEAPHLANMTHVDAVVELPAGARVLAKSALDPHSALEFGERVFGVQFHPEIDAEVMADYVAMRWELLVGEGLDAQRIQSSISEAAAGRSVLQRFLTLAGVAGRAARD